MEMPTGLELIRHDYVDQFIDNPDDSWAVWYDPEGDCVIRKINSQIILLSFLKVLLVLRLNRLL
jgi:hypothetical protein